nr:hypothetical protein [Tanacetum cinerariifolium]
MVNTRTDAKLAAAVKNALQTLLLQIRAEIREEFRTGSRPSGSGPSGFGGNTLPVTIHTWLERFNKQKPYLFEKATAPVDAENWISHMEKIFDVMGSQCLVDLLQRAITELVYLVKVHHHLNLIFIPKYDSPRRIDDGIVKLVLEAHGIPLMFGEVQLSLLESSYLSVGGGSSDLEGLTEAFEDKADLPQPGELYWWMRQRGRLQTFIAYRMIKSFWDSRPLSDDL